MSLILIAEDDNEIAMLEKDYLEISGFEIVTADNGIKAEELIKSREFDLIILDIMLPGKSGYDICRNIRDIVDTPIIMVTAKTESIDKIRGLGLGADDYVVKPFDPAELVARVKAHIQRYERLTGRKNSDDIRINDDADDHSVVIGNIKILLKSWKVVKNGVEIKFPNREFELLKFLALNPNIVFSKEQLFEKIWGYDYAGDSATVTVHINRIREKVEDDPKNPSIIETVWGAGYRLNM